MMMTMMQMTRFYPPSIIAAVDPVAVLAVFDQVPQVTADTGLLPVHQTRLMLESRTYLSFIIYCLLSIMSSTNRGMRNTLDYLKKDEKVSSRPQRGFGCWLVLDNIVNIWAHLKFERKVKLGAIESG